MNQIYFQNFDLRNFDNLASQKLTEMRSKEQLAKPVMKTKVSRE